jgi:protein-L-isoaspartate(D-aspartate) O-methyltransferase
VGSEAAERAGALRGQLTDQLLAEGRIGTEPVAAAFRAVPRHHFLPGVDLDVAYADDAVVTKWSPDGRPVSSSSQPAIMALMLEQLGLRPGHRVLEIGAGTGYNAALIAHLVGARGAVVTVDIDDDLVAQARENLARAGGTGVTVVCGDGAEGWAPGSPYDRIIVTAGAWDVAPAWRDQLAADGRIVLPLSLRGVQRSVAFQPVGDRLAAVSILDCGFMPLRGAMAEPGGPRLLGDQPGLFVHVDGDRELDTAALYAALGQPGATVPVGIAVTTKELWGGLALWLALREPALGGLSAIGPSAQLGLVPPLSVLPQQVMTMALVGETGLAALVRPDAAGGDPFCGPDAPPFELAVRRFGAGSEQLADRLVEQARAWDAQGRPSTGELRLTAHPPTTSDAELTGVVIDKRHTRLELLWSPPGGG